MGLNLGENMALETLTGIKKIGGFEVTGGVSNFGKERHIFIHDETNQLSFQIQNGPIKEKRVSTQGTRETPRKIP